MTNPAPEVISIEAPKKLGHIPKDERKTILLLSDDCRMYSGVGVMSREIIAGTAHRYNWLQIGGGINHPDFGKNIDISHEINKEAGIDDSYVRCFGYNGYGDSNLVRDVFKVEKIDAVMHFTDPRYWIWLYEIEHEIRQKVPLMYYHVWDDVPPPKYNESYYRSCDWIACISKQTYGIVKSVWQKDKPEDWQISYVPHGINPSKFFRIPTDNVELNKQKTDMRKALFANDPVDFVVLYNNRNVRRKLTGNVIMAYKHFINQLPKEQANRCRLLLHTAPVDENGTDLIKFIDHLAPEIKAVFSAGKVGTNVMNSIYNLSDVVINLANAEGFGLGTAEALMAELPIVVNVTGGLQDQCGFRDENGNLLWVDTHYTDKWMTNSDGKYKTYGEWALPIFPVCTALIGSPPTPYIAEDYCRWEDAGDALLKLYNTPKEERVEMGRKGREYMLGESKLYSDNMIQQMMDGIDTTLEKFTPRKPFTLLKI